MHDSFVTIAQAGESLFKIKGSRFVGRAWPTDTSTLALKQLSGIARKYHDATHHCFAYRLGIGRDEKFRYSDSGEPSGTAGKPIFQSICDNNLTDILVVVTRYFGGTKLGTGGLQQAYRRSSQEAIQACPFMKRHLARPITARFEYSFQNAVMRYLASNNIKVANSVYADDAELSLHVRLGFVKRFRVDIKNLTRGSARLEESGEIVKV